MRKKNFPWVIFPALWQQTNTASPHRIERLLLALLLHVSSLGSLVRNDAGSLRVLLRLLFPLGL